LTKYTIPNIAYSVNKLSRYTSNPDERHWTALERVMRYLKGTIAYDLHYDKFSSVLEGYSDVGLMTQ